MVNLFEVVSLNEDGLDKAPFPEVPYYLHAAEGNYIYRNTQVGTVLLPEKKPLKLGRVGFKDGSFTWTPDKVPANIISQAHHFFARIFKTHGTEAEVVITMHNETGEFRLFVPYQRTNHSGVKSIFDPSHIDRNYTVVGTLHSHCDFSAFHSGTDSGDASDMDGVHFTIGHVNKDVPQIVAMVAMAGTEFHYKDPTEIAEIEYGKETAPLWWDQYVFTHGNAPAIKPKGLKSLTQAHWDEFLGRALVTAPKPKTTYTPPVHSKDCRCWQCTKKERSNHWVSPYAGQHSTPPTPVITQTNHQKMLADWNDAREANDWRDRTYGALADSEAFNTRQHRKRTPKCGIPHLDQINSALDLAEFTGIFNEDDWHDVKPEDMDETAFWKEFFIKKMNQAAEVLDILGTVTTWELTEKEPPKTGRKKGRK